MKPSSKDDTFMKSAGELSVAKEKFGWSNSFFFKYKSNFVEK